MDTQTSLSASDALADPTDGRIAIMEQPARQKRSITLDPEVAKGVDELVAQGLVDSFSAAINEAATRWVYNRRLRQVLDEIYEEDPSARPTPEEIARAEQKLRG
jgi:Arc/MetJ-type ribon-helix-helix transcriptional regulator